MKFKIFIIITLLFSSLASGYALDVQMPAVHCSEDTVRVNDLLGKLRSSGGSLGDRMAMAAKLLKETPGDHYYTTDSIAALRINVDSFSPLMFVNTVAALAKASMKSGYTDWRTFAAEFEDISTRRGKDTGYASIMFHTSDWINDNVSRGNVKELTENFSGGVVARTKSLDEMTRFRQNFPALADSATFEKVRMNEMGYRTHRIPTLKKETIKKKEILDELKNGDVVILVPSRDGIDFYDIGIVEMEDDGPHFIHLSPSEGKITEEEVLTRYFPLMTKYFQGYRIIRMVE